MRYRGCFLLCKKMARSRRRYLKRVKNKLLKETLARFEADQEEIVQKMCLDMVDYVVRKEETDNMLSCYDPDTLSTTKNENEPTSPCGNDHCAKGCVCNSLKKKVLPKHCKKIECIFQCECHGKLNYHLRDLPHRRSLEKVE